jgi:hypothetical protein
VPLSSSRETCGKGLPFRRRCKRRLCGRRCSVIVGRGQSDDLMDKASKSPDIRHAPRSHRRFFARTRGALGPRHAKPLLIFAWRHPGRLNEAARPWPGSLARPKLERAFHNAIEKCYRRQAGHFIERTKISENRSTISECAQIRLVASQFVLESVWQISDEMRLPDQAARSMI